ncbi:hypothetical protein BJ875DRAFT_506920 [Amylocarpus encephaloides]|uniref:White collar 1 protein n=1 Tax=Amylocarpus encephaloides TaxID=45428 RepID=A0A9P7YC72_9HELO|nr:hypothetical protein BJ875DRAFT_506920 [Amylocarpus encephaloides]
MNITSPQSNHAMGMEPMVSGDSLDDILMQNGMEIQRRQSLPQAYSNQEPDRRTSMMEFGSSNGNFIDFQFGESTSGLGDPNMRRQSSGELFQGVYSDMSSGMSMPSPQMGYSTSMDPSNSLTLDPMSSPYSRLPSDMMQSIMSYAPMTMEGMSEEDLFPTANYGQTYGGRMDNMSNGFMVAQNMQTPLQSQNENTGFGGNDNGGNHMMSNMSAHGGTDLDPSSPQKMNLHRRVSLYASPLYNHPSISHTESSFGVPGSMPSVSSPTTAVQTPKPEPNYTGIYSTSGFDMLEILMKVATRKNPEIDIGKVDMSCAFVVCNILMDDCPIVYVSDIFERLTGYSKHEVIGRNCRFLQSPEGKVEAGAKREFVDNDSVYYLKSRISDQKEAQRSLINYRKGGQPFMNLLTMIPTTGEDDVHIKYFVGFQVDLVEKPTSVEGKNASGLYTVDYSQGTLPRYVWSPPDTLRNPMVVGQTISRDDVAAVLNSINNHTESELTKRMWDRVLLENTDDVVHVLSLKGLFLYLSPSCRHVLEYESSELVGTALSSICHPSDIVPVTRELKDTSTGAPVNVVFRIRRKKSGYTWFESHGSLCAEQGKGRKFIVLVGRERPVYALARSDLDVAGGIGESEIWSKLSTSGMFLFVSSSAGILLDRMPDELIGTSIQVLMRERSKVEFGRSLEKARTGKKVVHKHEILNKRGVELQAQTTLYPGDAVEGTKPTFLVAQTRLLKVPRSGTVTTCSKSTGAMHGQTDTPTPLRHPSGMTPSTSSQLVIGPLTQPGGAGLAIGSQDLALASEDNIFDELKTTRCTSWQFELRQMEKNNRSLGEELALLLSQRKKRKRRKGGPQQRDCINCHARSTPEWRRGPSGNRDLCNSCGLRWAKQVSQSNSGVSPTVRDAVINWSTSTSSSRS